MNLSLLYSNQRHVSATYVAIFRVEKQEYGHNYNVLELIHT